MSGLIYTYESMANALQLWPETNDPEYIANLPEIIQEGEDQLIRAFGLQIFEDTDVTAMTAQSNELQKPTNFITLSEMWYDDPATGLHQMIRATPDWVRAYSGSQLAPNLGLPKYYCENDETTWLIAPIPLLSNTMNIQVLRRPDTLSPGLPTGTSWLSEKYADLLLHQCLMVAERFLKNDDRWAVVKREFDIQLPAAKTETSSLRRVMQPDHITMRDIQRPANAEGSPNTL